MSSLSLWRLLPILATLSSPLPPRKNPAASWRQLALRAAPALERMRILQKGNRLSITPVDPAEWKYVVEKLMK